MGTPRSIRTSAKAHAQEAHGHSTVEFLLNIIPRSFFDAFASGDLLQVLLVSILTAFAISALGERGEPILHGIDTAAQIFFGIMRIIVRVAPLAALGAMAYTVGSYGLGALNRLLALMLGFYLTAGIFVVVVLGAIAWLRRLLDFPLPQLHQGRNPARARHEFIRDRVARHAAKDATRSAARNPPSGSSFRPATVSISTAPTST